MPIAPKTSCSDCEPSRRDFLKTTVGSVAAASAAAAGIITVTPRSLYAAPAIASQPETLVGTLFKSLTDEQKKAIAFPFDHQLRRQVNANWHITDKPIKDLFNKDQQALVREIFMGIHSPEYSEQVMKQVEHDNKPDGGFGGCAIAMFGQPAASANEESKFEFVLTGRHVTRRCDGNSVAGAAFGGPIFYGHAADSFNEKPDHPGNIYWYQAVRANEVFKALDGRQRQLALRADARKEEASKTVRLSGKKELVKGLPVTELSRDQKELVRKVMADVLAPFRKTDADEALALIEKTGGMDALTMSFYNNDGLDVGKDGVWDVWQIESPTMLWYFRGAPHVHTWVHIRDSAEV
jgi:hypothetical protein